MAKMNTGEQTSFIARQLWIGDGKIERRIELGDACRRLSAGSGGGAADRVIHSIYEVSKLRTALRQTQRLTLGKSNHACHRNVHNPGH